MAAVAVEAIDTWLGSTGDGGRQAAGLTGYIAKIEEAARS